jgi:hypothetical protein
VVRFESLIEEELSHSQRLIDDGTRHGSPITLSITVRMREDAWIAGKFIPWPISTDSDKGRVAEVTHEVTRSFIQPAGFQRRSAAFRTKLLVGNVVVGREASNLTRVKVSKSCRVQTSLKSRADQVFEVFSQQVEEKSFVQ